jgi:hypothetical protein
MASATTSGVCGLACDILRKTNDGDDLAPGCLALLELAVNGDTNEAGEKAFATLHACVMDGSYHKPWLQDVEHLTRDHAGYVYWKGQHVEHWSGDLPYSAEGKKAAHELSRRCKIIEERGDTPDVVKVVWRWTT